MRVSPLIALLLSAFAAWTEKVSASDSRQPTGSKLLRLELEWIGDGKCSALVKEHTFVLPDQKKELGAYLARFSSSKDAITLSGDVRYECVIEALAAAKSSGIKRLGFITEPLARNVP